jgi:hypothetical protein
MPRLAVVRHVIRQSRTCPRRSGLALRPLIDAHLARGDGEAISVDVLVTPQSVDLDGIDNDCDTKGRVVIVWFRITFGRADVATEKTGVSIDTQVSHPECPVIQAYCGMSISNVTNVMRSIL